MIYAGIDIAKFNHYAAVISSDGLVLTEPFKFSNDGDGFQRLSAELSDYAANVKQNFTSLGKHFFT